MNKLVHLAACCTTSDNLKFLIEKGANLYDLSSYKRNCLHFAAMNGRAENVKIILEANHTLCKVRDRMNKTPFAYACESED